MIKLKFSCISKFIFAFQAAARQVQPKTLDIIDKNYTITRKNLSFLLTPNILQPGGFLKVRCEATIPDLYNEASEVIIHTSGSSYFSTIHEERVGSTAHNSSSKYIW